MLDSNPSPRHEPEPPPLRTRLLWFAALWAAGVLSVGAAGLVIRWFLKV